VIQCAEVRISIDRSKTGTEKRSRIFLRDKVMKGTAALHMRRQKNVT